MARGYGIAVSCLCLCFYFYFSWRNSQFQKIRYAALIMFFYMLACMANTISLLLAPGLGLLCLIQLIRKKSLKRFLLSFWYGIGLTVAGILAMLIYHIRVIDSENEVLYMVESNSFNESFFENYAQMIVGYERWKFAAGLFLLFVCVLGVVCFIMCFSRWMKTEKDTERSIAGACVSVFVLESGCFDFSGGKESWRLLCNRKSDDAFLPADRSCD